MHRVAAALAVLTSAANASDLCWVGLAGANTGAGCDRTPLYDATEYSSQGCHGRVLKNKCIENNKGMGEGDGCNDHADKAACEADTRSRESDDKFDQTKGYCRFMPDMTKAQMQTACEVDTECTFYADRGHHDGTTHSGQCASSDAAETKEKAWKAQRGDDCDTRLNSGCVENNQWKGEAERCTNHKEEAACLAQTVGGDGVNTCSEGACTGNATTAGQACNQTSEHQCGETAGCTWKTQCCQWIPKPTDETATCMAGGTMEGLCRFRPADGPPRAALIKTGFEYKLFKKGPDAFEGKCAIVATFRNGKGSASMLGSDKPDILAKGCSAHKGTWGRIAEHIGHTSATIDEYCTNFIPEADAMSALKAHAPSEIILKAKQGQLGTVVPSLKDAPYIVSGRPEVGECLFTTIKGKFGAAVCTCDKKECNNLDAMKALVDPNTGPMRLLAFIDGSLLVYRDMLNSVIPDLMKEDGTLNLDKADQVILPHIQALMADPSLAAMTTEKELWGLIQDYQKMAKAIADYQAAQASPAPAPSPGAESAPAAPAAPPKKKVTFTMTIANVDLSKMDDAGKQELSSGIQETIAKEAGVEKEDVEVKLSAGSIKVEVSIKAVGDTSAVEAAVKAPALTDKVLTKAKTVKAVTDAATGDIAVTATAPEVTVEPTADAPDEAGASTSGAADKRIFLAVVAAALASKML